MAYELLFTVDGYVIVCEGGLEGSAVTAHCLLVNMAVLG